MNANSMVLLNPTVLVRTIINRKFVASKIALICCRVVLKVTYTTSSCQYVLAMFREDSSSVFSQSLEIQHLR